jgi:hypothetical protein
LEFDGASNSVHNAGELREDPVASQFHDSPLMRRDLGLDDIILNPLKCRERASLVKPHQPAVSHHIGGNNGR